jgi:hypothetical protein
MSADRDSVGMRNSVIDQSMNDFEVSQDIEAFDPEKTLVREDWESTAIRRVASHVAAVHSAIGGQLTEGRFGWESEGLRRLAQELERGGK